MLLQPQHYRQALFTPVQNDYDNLSVGILNGSHIQLIRILTESDSFGTGFDKVGKMVKMLLNQLGQQFLVMAIIQKRCMAEVPYMIGASCFIQQQVPVVESTHAAIQISNNLMGQSSSIDHTVSRTKFCILNAAFRNYHFQLWILPAHQIQRLKMITGIPVKCHTCNHVLRCFVHGVPRTRS